MKPLNQPKRFKLAFDYKTIKTFEDACLRLKIDPTKLPDVSMIPNEFRNTILNGYKLYVIFKAINNGWVPDWLNSQQLKYFPWFNILSSGFGFHASSYSSSSTRTHAGSRLCTDSLEKCNYISEMFQTEYKEFLLILN